MAELKRPVGRPGRYAEFEKFEANLPNTTPRVRYHDGIGIYKGVSGSTVYVKIRLRRGGVYKGKTIKAGEPVEHKLGKRVSWDWQQLVAERDRLQGLADRGEPLEAIEVPTFAEHAEVWLERKKATMKSYGLAKAHVISALNPAFGKMALNVISVSDINNWLGRQNKKRSPGTVQRQFALFNSIVNDAVRSGIIERNPSQKADRVRGVVPRHRIVDEDEWQTILKTVERIEAEQEASKERKPQQIRGWLRHYVVWAYHSAMRRTEILDLTWDHVRTLVDGTTVIEVVNTKTYKPRHVTCTEEMLSILASLRDLERADGDTRLFPVSRMTLRRGLEALWEATGLCDVRLHDLRRSHATILVNEGIDPRTVAGRMGHSGTAMLSKVYAVNLGDKRAAQVFDAFAKRSDTPTPKGDSTEVFGREPVLEDAPIVVRSV